MELKKVRTSESSGAGAGMGPRRPGDTGGAHDSEGLKPKLIADGEECGRNGSRHNPYFTRRWSLWPLFPYF